MSILVETSKSNPITNYQDVEISKYELNWMSLLPEMFPNIIPRSKESPVYNCHGLTFASRRTKILKSKLVYTIISDDAYKEILLADVLPGDIVIYLSNIGDINHSGIVIENKKSNILPLICSKWGNAGEFIHSLLDIPRPQYGPNYKFFRCTL